MLSIMHAHDKNCSSFCTKLWLDYKSFYKDCFKTFPIMLALCVMLSETYYAQNYAGIIGLQLGLTMCYFYRIPHSCLHI